MFIPIGDDVNKRNFPAVGSILIAVNVVVFLHMNRLENEAPVIQGPADYAAYVSSDYWEFTTKWGAVVRNIEQGHVMCLLTHMFLHGDFLHLLGNMLVLWAFVGTLENSLGPGRFLSFYFLWGLIAGAAHLGATWALGGKSDDILFWKDRPMIGASGAIAGMIGAYFVAFGALTKIRVLIWFMYFRVVNVPAGAFVFLWVLSQLSGLDEELTEGGTGVAWYAHLGGFAAGAATMFLLRKQVLRRMFRDTYGVWHIKDEEAAEETTQAAASEETSENVPVPDSPPLPDHPAACPNCGTAVSVENKIHDSLLRCPNPSCQKLIFYQ